MKNSYLKNQKNKKAVNDYTNLITKIRNEYAQLQKEKNQLEIEIHKCQQYFQDFEQKYKTPRYVKRRPKRKRIQYYDESDESDFYVTEIRKRPWEQKRKIYYDDNIDGFPYEPGSQNQRRRRRIIRWKSKKIKKKQQSIKTNR